MARRNLQMASKLFLAAQEFRGTAQRSCIYRRQRSPTNRLGHAPRRNQRRMSLRPYQLTMHYGGADFVTKALRITIKTTDDPDTGIRLGRAREVLCSRVAGAAETYPVVGFVCSLNGDSE